MPQSLPSSKKGLTMATLMGIAALAMLVGHLAWAWLPTDTVLGFTMHLAGQVSAPLMFYFLVEGYYNSKNINRYTLGIAVFAVLSYLPFFYYEFGTLPSRWEFAPFGMGYSLLLALLFLRAMQELDMKIMEILVFCVLALFSLWGDWAVTGLAIVFVFSKFRGNFKKQALFCVPVFVAPVILFWVLGTGLLSLAQLGQFFALPLMRLYSGRPGRFAGAAKIGFYAFYPLHLAVLGLLRWGVSV